MGINKYPRFGRIASVFIKPEENNVFVNVTTGPKQEPREMRYVSQKLGLWLVPAEGDIVEVHRISGEFVAKNAITSTEVPFPPDLSERDFCLKFNDQTQLWFSKQGDGSFNLDVEADGDISITSNGGTVDISTTAGGNVVIDGIDFDQHTHSYSDDDGSGTSTRTTAGPQ